MDYLNILHILHIIPVKKTNNCLLLGGLLWLLRRSITIDISGVNNAWDVMDDGLCLCYRWPNRRLK